MVPSVLHLMERGFGRKKGITGSMIAAGTFDDILCIIIFGIVKTLGFSGLEK
jgi:hypothetical protein